MAKRLEDCASDNPADNAEDDVANQPFANRLTILLPMNPAIRPTTSQATIPILFSSYEVACCLLS